MSTNVPIISVTADSLRYEHHSSSASSDSDYNFSNDLEYNQNFGGLTDVEDIDSYTDAAKPIFGRSFRNSLVILKKMPNTGGDVTDIEDYNDSEEEEDDKSNSYPDFKLSLREFLQHDFQEHFSTNNGVKELVQYKSGNFLQAQNWNTIHDFLTDFEDFNTDSEIENNFEKSACVDLKDVIVELCNLNIADSAAKIQNCAEFDSDLAEISLTSDLSSAASALVGVMNKEVLGISEDEILYLSSNAKDFEIYSSKSNSISNSGNISEEDLLSSTSLKRIDGTAIHGTNWAALNNVSFPRSSFSKDSLRKNMFLEVEGKQKEEVLTETERFDDSVAESVDDDSFQDEDDGQQPIPQAVILTLSDDWGSITDCEDLFYDDVCEEDASGQMSAISVELSAMPQPQKEVVMLKEDKFGGTIASVMPMDNEYQLGIYATSKNECLTDTEDISYTDDMEIPLADPSSHSISPSPNNVRIESEITIANELLKHQKSKRLAISFNTESVTDVEEIYLTGPNVRKKKVKSRAVPKTKSKFFETIKSTTIYNTALTGDKGGELVPNTFFNKDETNRYSIQVNFEKGTDIEDLSVDDVSYVSETKFSPIDSYTTYLKDKIVSSKNIEERMGTYGSIKCNRKSTVNNAINTELKSVYLTTNQNFQQEQTNIKDVQFPSDSKEGMNINVPVADYAWREINEMLGESYTTVHEKCGNNFSVNAEKLHIKSMLRESHTDTEYVESDEPATRSNK